MRLPLLVASIVVLVGNAPAVDPRNFPSKPGPHDIPGWMERGGRERERLAARVALRKSVLLLPPLLQPSLDLPAPTPASRPLLPIVQRAGSFGCPKAESPEKKLECRDGDRPRARLRSLERHYCRKGRRRTRVANADELVGRKAQVRTHYRVVLEELRSARSCTPRSVAGLASQPVWRFDACGVYDDPSRLSSPVRITSAVGDNAPSCCGPPRALKQMYSVRPPLGLKKITRNRPHRATALKSRK